VNVSLVHTSYEAEYECKQCSILNALAIRLKFAEKVLKLVKRRRWRRWESTVAEWLANWQFDRANPRLICRLIRTGAWDAAQLIHQCSLQA